MATTIAVIPIARDQAGTHAYATGIISAVLSAPVRSFNVPSETPQTGPRPSSRA